MMDAYFLKPLFDSLRLPDRVILADVRKEYEKGHKLHSTGSIMDSANVKGIKFPFGIVFQAEIHVPSFATDITYRISNYSSSRG